MIAGIDYDTNRIAVCAIAWDGSRIALRTRDYRGKLDAFQAVRNIAVQIGTLYDLPIKVWWVEHAFGRGPTDFKLGRVQGAIVAAIEAIDSDAAINECGPPEWKKGVGLPGNAKKDLYVPQLRLKLTLDHGVPAEQDVSEHELDAYGIALYGLAVNARQ